MEILLGTVLKIGYTKAVQFVIKAYPLLDKGDPQIADLINHDARADYDRKLQLFKEGANLKRIDE